MKKEILIFAIALSVMSCNKSKPYDDVDTETLKPDGSEDTRPKYSFEQELADATCRFVSDRMTLSYDDGGVIFSREKGETGVTYRAIELATGNTVELNISATSPRLIINDIETTVKSVTVERENEKGAWINIQTPDYKHIVFVVTDL